MAVSRIVLDPRVRSVVDQIQEKTQTTSPSAAITLLVSRYGRHLLETWELTTERCPEPATATAAPAPSPTPMTFAEFTFNEAIEF